jgi:hypothetical protein
MAITFFKTPRNKQYNYKPVFWDKTKEEREKRHSLAMDEKDKDYAQALRDRMEIRWRRKAGATTKRNSNLRLVVIIGILVLLSYLIFY